MELLRGIHNLKSAHKGCVLSIGVGFNKRDGVHLFYNAILSYFVFFKADY